MVTTRRVNGGKNASSLVTGIASPGASSFSSGRSSGLHEKNVSIARSRWHLRVSRVAAGSESRAASRSALTEKRATSTTASGFHALATRAARRYSKTASPPAVTMVCGGSINVGLSSHSSRFSAVSDESHPPRRRKRLPDATSLERRRHRASDGGSFLMALREQSSDSRLANLPSAEGSAVSWLWLTSSARSRSGWNARHKPGGTRRRFWYAHVTSVANEEDDDVFATPLPEASNVLHVGGTAAVSSVSMPSASTSESSECSYRRTEPSSSEEVAPATSPSRRARSLPGEIPGERKAQRRDFFPAALGRLSVVRVIPLAARVRGVAQKRGRGVHARREAHAARLHLAPARGCDEGRRERNGLISLLNRFSVFRSLEIARARIPRGAWEADGVPAASALGGPARGVRVPRRVRGALDRES